MNLLHDALVEVFRADLVPVLLGLYEDLDQFRHCPGVPRFRDLAAVCAAARTFLEGWTPFDLPLDEDLERVVRRLVEGLVEDVLDWHHARSAYIRRLSSEDEFEVWRLLQWLNALTRPTRKKREEFKHAVGTQFDVCR